jgi:hypothetical protein
MQRSLRTEVMKAFAREVASPSGGSAAAPDRIGSLSSERRWRRGSPGITEDQTGATMVGVACRSAQIFDPLAITPFASPPSVTQAKSKQVTTFQTSQSARRSEQPNLLLTSLPEN